MNLRSALSRSFPDAEARAIPDWVLVPREPTPEMLAAAALAVLPLPPDADCELAKKAAVMVAMGGETRDTLLEIAAVLSTMPAFWRAMIAAAPAPTILEDCGTDAEEQRATLARRVGT